MTTKDHHTLLAQIAAAVREERLRAGLSLSELARRVGISKSTVSQLETAQGNPSVETLWSIASTLGIPFARLVAAPSPRPQIIRAEERAAVPSATADFHAALLHSGSSPAQRDLYVVSLEPGDVREAEPHPPGSTEHVLIGSGRVRLGPADAPFLLHPGDYAVFPGDAPHSYEALTPGAWFTLLMEHPSAEPRWGGHR
ncbi:XRE family transcriptional regulator [Nesterenkonia sp. HG001]|uniref:helix-turn-helix domain-containing protein n=1 Tax=Nesterenkonia sp. HG001 TaxID=2983207 RepID=UPI002AC75358|nr:XRE family transcriptional regulator [Nesterenkonia sp. HG001]MDZ5078931.1 XRE family transcriptional regulator [Nesterenkonia sp. HG001]